MADKKLQKSVDQLRVDIQELGEAFWSFRDGMLTQQAAHQAETQSAAPPPAKSINTDVLQDKTVSSEEHGYVSGFGFYASPESNTAIRWSMPETPVSAIDAIDVEASARLLAALGNPQRLSIATLLLRKPATAAEVVSAIGLATTGAAYHHLNVLQNAGLVEQAQRGTFSIPTDRVPAMFGVLTALSGEAAVEALDAIPEPSAPSEKKKKKA